MSEFDIGGAFPGWETDGVLGSGTFGTVYLAHRTVEDKPVYAAVKVIKTPPSAEAIDNAEKMGIGRDLLKTYFNKFKNDLNWELTMFRTVESKHLVPVDAIETTDLPDAGWIGYIRTPVLTPLKVYFGKAESGCEDAARLGAEVCSALESCAEYGMVHGEITPENIMVTDSGTFMLSDFGIKRCLEKAGTGLFGVFGSEFEAPELENDRTYTQKSDIYSLGMLMSYVANGCRMPENGDPDSISGMDGELAAIIKKATAQSPDDRYVNAAQMREDICKLGLFINRRPQRRAVAAAAAFELVRANGSTITGESVKKAEPAAAPEIKAGAAVPDVPGRAVPSKPAEKKKKKWLAWLIAFLAVAALIAGIVIAKPFAGKDGKNADTDVTDKTENEEKSDDEKTADTEKTEDAEKENAPEEKSEGEDEKPEDNKEETADEKPEEQENNGDEQPEEQKPDDQKPEDPEKTDEPKDEEKPDAGTYLLPTDTKLITESDLEGMDDGELAMVINEVYARHGKIFKTDSIQKYFEGQGWYKPVTKDSAAIEAKFSSTEKQNIKTLTAYRDKLKNGGSEKTEQPEQQSETPAQPQEQTKPEAKNNDVLFPSDTTLITESDLEGKTRSETYMLINEIYARHGKMFDSKDVQDYFDSQVWYKPVSKSYSKAEAGFNETEWANIDAIIAYQDAHGYR